MKKIITIVLTASALGLIAGCADHERTTTTTEETTIHRPVDAATTTETQTVRPGY